jgi:hypothetical protein
MKVDRRTTIAEVRAVARVEERFRRESFGQSHIVRVELDMEIMHLGHGFLKDRTAIDQMFDRDQHAIGQDGVIG